MTDYLEELVENANVLLEQLMQLERGLFVGENRDFVDEIENINLNKFSVDKYETSVNHQLKQDYNMESGLFLGETELVKESGLSEKQPLQGEKQTRTEKPALLEELERAEQMSTAIETEKTIGRHEADRELNPSGARYGLISLGGDTEPNRNGVASPGTIQSEFAAGETLDWAEQADRVFRRDSRRYDGGFYLY